MLFCLSYRRGLPHVYSEPMVSLETLEHAKVGIYKRTVDLRECIQRRECLVVSYNLPGVSLSTVHPFWLIAAGIGVVGVIPIGTDGAEDHLQDIAVVRFVVNNIGHFVSRMQAVVQKL